MSSKIGFFFFGHIMLVRTILNHLVFCPYFHAQPLSMATATPPSSFCLPQATRRFTCGSRRGSRTALYFWLPAQPTTASLWSNTPHSRYDTIHICVATYQPTSTWQLYPDYSSRARLQSLMSSSSQGVIFDIKYNVKARMRILYQKIIRKTRLFDIHVLSSSCS